MKRRIFKMIFLLLAGAIINIALAWGSTARNVTACAPNHVKMGRLPLEPAHQREKRIETTFVVWQYEGGERWFVRPSGRDPHCQTEADKQFLEMQLIAMTHCGWVLGPVN